jgi:hypothetical protein
MERVIIFEVIPCFISIWQKREKPTRCLMVFKRRLRGFREVPRASLRESAKRYRRSTCHRSSRGVATRATGVSGGVPGEDLHRYLKLNPHPPISQETADGNSAHFTRQHACKFDKWPFLVHASRRCISPPPTRLVAFPATSVAVWPVRVCARVVDNFLFISILFLAKTPTL